MIIESQIKKWGNSLGIVVPKDVVRKDNLRENKKVRLIILKDGSKALKATFGIAKNKIKKSAQELKDEARKELYE